MASSGGLGIPGQAAAAFAIPPTSISGHRCIDCDFHQTSDPVNIDDVDRRDQFSHVYVDVDFDRDKHDGVNDFLDLLVDLLVDGNADNNVGLLCSRMESDEWMVWT